MRKLVIVLILLAIYNCQTVIVEKMSTGDKYDKEIINPANDNVRDIAIYGWFKLNSGLSRGGWGTLFHFTSNTKDLFIDGHRLGDRSLSMFVINNVFVTPTYSVQPANPNVYANLNFVAADVDKWAFFYVGHSEEGSCQYTHIDFDTTRIRSTLDNIIHLPSKYYRLMVGQSVNYQYFQGSIQKLTISFGTGSFRNSNFEALSSSTNPLTPAYPSPKPSCVAFYTQCNYTGIQTLACGQLPYLDVANIKSVYIPENVTYYTIYGQANYQGQQVKFTASIPCIDKLAWTYTLVENKSVVTPKKQMLKRNAH